MITLHAGRSVFSSPFLIKTKELYGRESKPLRKLHELL